MKETIKIQAEYSDNRDGISSFSLSRAKIFIANYLDKIFGLCILLLVVFTILTVGYISLYGIIILLILIAIPYFYGKFQHKFAYKIIVDFNSGIIYLYMQRSESIIAVDFCDINSIRVNGYIILTLNDRKVFYNDLQNANLLTCLNKIKNIQWGFLCNLWGPKKNIRDAISCNSEGNC